MALSLLAGYPLRRVSMTLSLNGDATSTLGSAAPFTFYIDTAFNISRTHPLGGPIRGGTDLHVYLIDERLLVDFGGTAHGPACRFTYVEPSPSRHTTFERNVVVPATLSNCGGSRSCGAGWGLLACTMPPHEGPLDTNGVGEVLVEVTINGQHYTTSGSTYRYYDPRTWHTTSFSPFGGPLTGNTTVSIISSHLYPLGDARCRFGDDLLTAEVNASIDAAHVVTCTSPPHWILYDGTKRVELQLTLNGQDYMSVGMQHSIYTFYTLDDARYGLTVRHLSPNGGPSAGGTLVRVDGTGFVDLGGVLCQFAGEPAVPATIVNDLTMLCTSPMTSTHSSFEERSLAVTLNGQLHARTRTSVVPFIYYAWTDVRVSVIYPQGGPLDGNIAVTVWGVGFRDLDHGKGLQCSFGWGSERLVSATLSASAHGGEALICMSPAVRATQLPASAEQCTGGPTVVPLRISLNGNNSAIGANGPWALTREDDNVTFTYLALE